MMQIDKEKVLSLTLVVCKKIIAFLWKFIKWSIGLFLYINYVWIKLFIRLMNFIAGVHTIRIVEEKPNPFRFWEW